MTGAVGEGPVNVFLMTGVGTSDKALGMTVVIIFF